MTSRRSNGYGKNLHDSDNDDDEDDKHYDVNAAVQGLISDLEGSAAFQQERVMMSHPETGVKVETERNGYVDNYAHEGYSNNLYNNKASADPEYTASSSSLHENATKQSFSVGRSMSIEQHVPQEEVMFIEESEGRGGDFADEEDVLLNEASGQMATNTRPRYLRNYFCYKLCSWRTAVCVGSILLIVGAVGVVKRLSSPRTSPPESNSFTVPPPPSELEVFCSHNYIRDLNNGEEECRAACEPGSCCFEDELNRSHSAESQGGCFSENYKVCAQYSVCLLLDTFSSNSDSDATNSAPVEHSSHFVVEMPSTDIAASCSSMAITTQEGLDLCKSSCEPSKCCFMQRDSENCYSFKDNFESCDAYRSFCSKLGMHFGGTGAEPTVPPEDVSTNSTTVDANNEDSQDGSDDANDNDTSEPATQPSAEEGEVPEPPSTLSLVCSDPSDKDLIELCKEQCAAASCCTTSDPTLNCFFSNEATCSKYVACEILMEVESTTTSMLDAAPSDLALVCTNVMDPEYRDTCEELCKASECCSSSCKDDPLCAGYEPCDSLHTTTTTTPSSSIPVAREDIDQICTEDNIKNFRSDCEDSCRPAYCCWTLTEGENCMIENVDECNSYESCRNLSMVPPVPPDDLPNLCSIETIEQDYSDIDLTVIDGVPWLDETSGQSLTCKNVCEKVLCCLGSELSNGLVCPDYADRICRDYKFCSVLDPVYDILSLPVPGTSSNSGAPVLQDKPDELVSACSSKLTQKGEDDGGACEAACAPAKCCIEGTGVDYCFIDNRDTCNAYGICFVLPEVAIACSHDNLAFTEGQEQCENLCAPHSCCFEPGPDGESCWYDEWDECVKYAPCFSLLGINNGKITHDDQGDSPQPEDNGITVDVKPPDLNEKCAGILKGESASAECLSDCALADCCVKEGEQDCFESNVQTCSSYGICFVLPEVATSCSHTSIETDSGHEECYNLCYPHNCCFTSGPENCYSERQKECMKYAACFTLLAFHGGSLPPPEEFTLGEDGSNNSDSIENEVDLSESGESNNGEPNNTPANPSSSVIPTIDHPDVAGICSVYSSEFNEALCQQDCSVASCCIHEGDDNCYKEHEDACLSYGPCFTDAAVSVSCNGDQLTSLESRSDCLDVCTPYACCFELKATGATTCPPEKETHCIKFLPCAAVASLLIENP